MTKQVKKYFWLALLAHLLLFLSFSLELAFDSDLPFEKKSERYLPAYLYQEANRAQASSPSLPQTVNAKQPPPEPEKRNPETIALKKQEIRQKEQVSQPPRPSSQSSATFMQAESPKSGKPIDEPLLKELSRATAAKLYYPAEAAAFHIKGMVTISFLLHPDGRVEDVSVAQSSGFRVLDEAALNSIKAISPVRDANMYLTKARYMLAGIIFG